MAVIHAPYQRVLDHFTEDGADLLLAGHTHGGQLCIPGYGALIANCDIPTWRAKGLTTGKATDFTTPVNVSGGIGTSRFAPVRIACKPEAVLLTLTARSSRSLLGHSFKAVVKRITPWHRVVAKGNYILHCRA